MIPNETSERLDGVQLLHAETSATAASRDSAGRWTSSFRSSSASGRWSSWREARRATIFDLYDPILFEALGFYGGQQTSETSARQLSQAAVLKQILALQTGSAFICASERQRDLWLGVLGALGRIDLDRFRSDPSLDKLVGVVPFGLEADEPQATERVLKGVVPGIAESDKVLLWGGGIWNWLDPLTPIKAVAELSRRRPDVKLFFLGVQHPNPRVPAMVMTNRAVELAESLGVRDTHVFFNFGWTPYAERVGFLLEADLGISAHFDSVETRFAFRTRLLDYFWARLPIVATGGDVLGDLVEQQGLGRTVGEGTSKAGWMRSRACSTGRQGGRELRGSSLALRLADGRGAAVGDDRRRAPSSALPGESAPCARLVSLVRFLRHAEKPRGPRNAERDRHGPPPSKRSLEGKREHPPARRLQHDRSAGRPTGRDHARAHLLRARHALPRCRRLRRVRACACLPGAARADLGPRPDRDRRSRARCPPGRGRDAGRRPARSSDRRRADGVCAVGRRQPALPVFRPGRERAQAGSSRPVRARAVRICR